MVLEAQVEASVFLGGTAFVGDTAMVGGTVVLHHVNEGTQGELDSMAVGPDGSFTFRLPNVPDPGRGDVFFASIRHHGILYFGGAITTAAQLDTVYDIHAYDSMVAPVEGLPVTLQSRSVFFEPDSTGWRVTDLFQLRNDEPRTIVARPDGRVWSHPLPSEARDVIAGEGEMAFDAASFEQGSLVVRAALPPGERLFIVRYRLDSPIVNIPNLGRTEAFDVLIREPAPPLEVEGLDLIDRIELEAGTTYMRFAGVDVTVPLIRVVAAEEEAMLPVRWIAVILSLVLTVSGLVALRSGSAQPLARSADNRQSLLFQVARLDHDFGSGEVSAKARRSYDRRRAALIEQIRSVR